MKRLVLLLIILTFISGCSVKKTEELTDAEKFATEYSIVQVNSFKYATLDEIFQILEEGDGIILFGNSDCEVCSISIDVFSSVIEDKNISNVYYYNPKIIMDSDFEEYEKLIDLLGEAIGEDDKGNKTLELPNIFLVRSGKVIASSTQYKTELLDEDETYSDTNKEKLKQIYEYLIDKYLDYENTGDE